MLKLRTGDFDNPLRNAAARAESFGNSLGGVGGKLGGMSAAFAGAGLVIGGFTAAVAASNAALEGYAGYDGLVRGLKTLEGTSTNTKKRIAELRDVAKAPGLGFEEAVQGDIRLRSVGLSSDLSARSMKAFGNALATVGGGKAQLDGVLTALTQIQAKGVVSAEEINQIAERVPQIRAAMKGAFGTADTEGIQKLGLSTEQFIEGIVAQLELLPKVTGGAQNSLDNYNDAWAELKTTALEFFQPISSWFNELGTTFISQAAKDLRNFKEEWLGMDAPGLQGPDGMTDNERKAEAYRQEMANRRALNAQKAAQAEVDAHNAEVDSAERAARNKIEAEEFQAKRQADIRTRAQAKAAAAEEEYLKKTLTREQQIRRELEALRQQGAGQEQRFDATTNAGIYEATLKSKALQKELSDLLARDEEKKRSAAEQAEREAEAAQRKAESESRAAGERARAAADFDAENAILSARAAGNRKLVDELTKQREVERLKLDIMRQQGLSENEALAKARERVNLERAASGERRRGVLNAEDSAAARLARRSAADIARDERLGRNRITPAAAAEELARASAKADPGRTRRDEKAEANRRAADPVYASVKAIEEKLELITSS